jgi:hypothetical protein
VRARYREYWELEGMYNLAQIYDEIKDSLLPFLKLHQIVKEQGTGEKK